MAEQATRQLPTQGRLGEREAVRLLTAYLFALFAIPSRLIFAPLGSSGTPAQVLSLGLGVWFIGVWCAAVRSGWRPRDPLRRAMIVFAAAIFASEIAAAIRPIDTVEQRATDAGLLMVLGWLGLMLFTSEGLTTFAGIEKVLRRMVVAGGGLATLGLIQFATGNTLVNYIQIPGLTLNDTLPAVVTRAGINRPSGTTLHPIEFGAVLTMVLPIALYLAMNDVGRSPIRRWFPVLAIGFAIPISISRSAIISLIVVLLVLIPTWRTVTRRYAYLTILVIGGGLFVAVPGLLGTLTGLFTGITNDSSARSRSDSYSTALEFIRERPLFGRGFLTYLPSYHILDNQYLGLLIDTGFVGLGTFLMLLLTGWTCARNVRKSSSDERVRALTQALAASIASVGFSFAFFDAFSFPMTGGMLVLLLGITSALRNISISRTGENAIQGGRTPSSITG